MTYVCVSKKQALKFWYNVSFLGDLNYAHQMKN